MLAIADACAFEQHVTGQIGETYEQRFNDVGTLIKCPVGFSLSERNNNISSLVRTLASMRRSVNRY